MSEENIEKLDAELARLLRSGAPKDEVPKGMDARLLARLSSSIPGLLPPDGGGGVGSPPPETSATAPTAGLGLAPLALAAAVVLGLGGAAVLTSRGAPVATPTTTPRSVPLAMATTTPSATASGDLLTVDIASLPSAKREEVARPKERETQALGERELLDEARAALLRGEPAMTLAAVERHAARFPRGLLTEEREALAVRALAAMGRRPEASARAERFRSAYPQSLFAPAVENAMRPK